MKPPGSNFPNINIVVTSNATTPNNTATMTNLDMLLLKGSQNDLTEENLAELRYAILTKGIPANSEGMVSFPALPHNNKGPDKDPTTLLAVQTPTSLKRY